LLLKREPHTPQISGIVKLRKNRPNGIRSMKIEERDRTIRNSARKS
jgi:hypothetical protein